MARRDADCCCVPAPLDLEPATGGRLAMRMMAMAFKSGTFRSLTLLCALGAATMGCEEKDPDEAAQPLPRPVSFVNLELTNPRLNTLVAGSVESWKKEMIGHRVSGRVNFVREPGENIVGRIFGDDGEILEPGTTIGSIDNDRYLLRVREAEAQVRSAEAKAESIRVELEKTIPNLLSEEQAEFDRATKEDARQQQLLKDGAGVPKQADIARAALRESEARLGQVQSRKAEIESELASAEAEMVQAMEVLQQAKVDLADTQLHSPFNGQISKVHVIPGGFVEQGQPVVTVQMMDPVKIQVAVSPDTDRRVNYNDILKVYAEGSEEPLNGWVWKKDAVADASTRTFIVTLLVRNRQIEVDPPEQLGDVDAYPTSDILPVDSEHDDGAPPYFVDELTLHKDEQGYFVWKVEGLTVADLKGTFDPFFKVKKLRVSPGSRRMPFLQTFTYRELADIGELNPSMDLIASGLPTKVEDGASVYLSRKRWLLRPGELVKVDLRSGQIPPGFYVPVQAIIKEDADHHVFVVTEQANGAQEAKKVAVRVGDTIGTFQGIEPVTDGDLAEGMKLIVEGAHYLRDGEAVNAFFEVEQAL
ncbi:MAG: HlyD family efflux transporter periplasmic adaptor subunit [Kiloniellales bacterium]|nr:HlyD family efflux transporter periplasmic adaptor subunit [Kiloniellales bacterium]